MVYSIAADMVIVIHLLWIVCIIAGFPIVLYFNTATGRLIHLAACVITVAMQISQTICPLTYLEAYLKFRSAPHEVYPGSFIIRTIENLIYVDDMTLPKIMYVTMIYFVIVVFSFWFRPLERRK
jgi:hypothetical protein